LSRRNQFIRNIGVQLMPTGNVVERYGFMHVVYRQVFYERLSASKCILLHRRIAERGEQVYGARSAEIAPQLALHFERAVNYERAVHYLQQAAHNAMLRSAYREAVALSRRGLELLVTLPETVERAREELRLHLALGVPLIATEGYAAPAVGVIYVKARALC